ncbi:capsular polysaccharide biosynthesis protein [Otariodibacter oris]|uniref:Capsular polysaccharide export protein n=1 Tax=Otariodibacter oris TaxID=1032623 RepID=A0A420XGR8_9PAST|nr:capsular polysaccharide biosynthesis protein [Otariodibacter oris]QGM80102.1 capsule biosynthesis protein [Otariodibacter oris]RKR71929.1 capsular polysaccharide export protein [Otariodibacter oris]
MTDYALTFSRGIKKIPNIINLLPEYKGIKLKSFLSKKDDVTAIVGWGLRPSSEKARNYAKNNNIPYIAIEDGFLRSLGLGVEGYPPFSIICDDIGIYYDTTKPSRLEKLILDNTIDSYLLKEAEKALMLIIQNKLSKYNQTLDNNIIEKKENISAVLVIDQTYGDMAVKYGQADENNFNQMLDAAIKENPHCEVWVKTHPDVLSGKKKGYLTKLSDYQNQVRIITEDINPITLLEQVNKVYCVTSQMGFEGLMLGKEVITFGIPWYAGWGNTDDRNPNIVDLKEQNRREDRSILQMFAAAYLQYSRYLSPYSGQKGSIFDVIEYLSLAKSISQKLSGNLYCVGMSLWKRAVIKPFFNFPKTNLHFTSSLKALQKKKDIQDHAKLLIWSQGSEDLISFAEKQGLPVLRMEDGFVRSVGLGSNLVVPISLVVDDMGIYFNAQQVSRLEEILNTTIFSKQVLQMADTLRSYLIEKNIGKYNVGDSNFTLDINDKRTILVPGQVEDDASIRFGSPSIKKNLDLLKIVRKRNPDAYIIYKPHPDVVSGNRKGKVEYKDAINYADTVIETVNILDCINQVDEVHTMTSLAGFEALLRGKEVHCYGLPFYSNWGLTKDTINLPRRNRQLTLLELIAGVMIHYPYYVDPKNGQLIGVLQAIDILQKQKRMLLTNGLYRNWFAKQYGKLKQLIKVL